MEQQEQRFAGEKAALMEITSANAALDTKRWPMSV